MAHVTLSDNTTVYYDIIGSGPLLVLISGGRREGDWLRPTAEKLVAGGYSVLLHDRRNCGASDVVIERRYEGNRELSEQEIWVEDLYELLTRVHVTPAWIGGTSAGCRLSLMMAIKHPDAVQGLLLWRVSGGEYAAKNLGYNYYEQFNEIAAKDGMEGVIRTPFFAARIAQNPANRDRLLKLDPKEFISIMAYWRTFFTADKTVVGATDDEIRALRVPTLIIIAGDDDTHPLPVQEQLRAMLPHAEYHPPQWTKPESDALLADDKAYGRATAEKLPPVILAFLAKHAPVGV